MRMQGPVSIGVYMEPDPDVVVPRPEDGVWTSGDTHPTAQDV